MGPVSRLFALIICTLFVPLDAWAQQTGEDGATVGAPRPLNFGTVPLTNLPSPGSIGPVMPNMSSSDAEATNDLAALADLSPLVLNRTGRSAFARTLSYDGENDFWLFDGGSRVSVNSGTGRICVSTGSYRICHSR